MEYCENVQESITVYFHNLKFDGEFILCYLFNHGYHHAKDKKKAEAGNFTTLISDTGAFYSIEVCLETGKHARRIVFLDSYKVLPFKVEEVAECFALPMRKLEIDYDRPRPVGYQMTAEEVNYLKNDVLIVSQALFHLFNEGLKKMTTASNALHDFKSLIGKAKFEYYFPTLPYDKYLRKSYKGGWTYANPLYAGKDIKEGIVLDVNSLYPAMLAGKPLPYGEGIFYTGAYENDDLYPLYIQRIRCQFYIKEGKLPTIQIKGGLRFIPTEYITDSAGENIELALTNIDLALFLEQYEVFDLEYVDGYKFKSSTDLFKVYVDKWMAVKIQATKDGNESMRTIAKLMLNSLYGKFAISPEVRSKYPVMDEDGSIRYVLHKEDDREPLYLPVASFVTSWARYTTIKSAQSVYERFLYADTDSLHLIGLEIPENLEISDTELGKWKLENTFTRARFLRAKSYIEEIKGELKVTCSGMPEDLHQFVDWNNFRINMEYVGEYREIVDETGRSYGYRYEGKLKPIHVAGGIVLEPVKFTIKG